MLRAWRNLCVTKFKSIKNTITTNAYWCIELNAHSLVNYIDLCREENLPYLPELLQSQTCEGFFRTARSFTSTESTVVNFTMKSFESKLNRIQAKTDVTHDATNGFVFPRVEKHKSIAGRNYTLPTITEVMKIIENARIAALKTLTELGINTEDINFKESIVLRPGGLRNNVSDAGNFEFVNTAACESDEEEGFNASGIIEESMLDSTDDVGNYEFVDSSAFEADPEVAIISPGNVADDSELDRVYDARDLFTHGAETFDFADSRNLNPNHSFKIRNSNGKIININIKTFLWMIQNGPVRCNVDRVKRFHEKTAKKTTERDDRNEVRAFIERGDWVALNNKGSLIIAYVHGFRYLTGCRTAFTLDKCPVVPPSSSSSKGVGLVGNFYTASESNKLRLDESLSQGYLNIQSYITHLKKPTHDGSSWILAPTETKFISTILSEVSRN